MKRLAKVIPKESLIPEMRYLVFTNEGAIAWSGQLGIKYDLAKIGNRLAGLIKQHGSFAIIDGLRFLKVASALEKVTGAKIDKTNSVLIIEANDGKVEVSLPVTLDLPEELPHLQLDWSAIRSARKLPVESVWLDAVELISTEGTALWGDVVGVYETDKYVASFDYGILLYKAREVEGKKFGRQQPKGSKSTDIIFCPQYLLGLGLAGIGEAAYNGESLYLVGDGVTYVTQPTPSTAVLDQMLQVRDLAHKGKQKAVSLDFGSGLWKRAKVFNRMVVTM